jgi:hypothetical protein
MNTQLKIALLTIAIVGFTCPSQAQIKVTPQDGTVYPTRTCYVIFDEGEGGEFFPTDKLMYYNSFPNVEEYKEVSLFQNI